jgi:hypothetical protein
MRRKKAELIVAVDMKTGKAIRCRMGKQGGRYAPGTVAEYRAGNRRSKREAIRWAESEWKEVLKVKIETGAFGFGRLNVLDSEEYSPSFIPPTE